MDTIENESITLDEKIIGPNNPLKSVWEATLRGTKVKVWITRNTKVIITRGKMLEKDKVIRLRRITDQLKGINVMSS